MSTAMIDSEHLEYLMRQLRGKIRAGCSGTYHHFVFQVLNEAEVHNLRLRVQFASEMRRMIAKEMNLEGTN